MISAAFGLAMFLGSLLLGRYIKIRLRIQPIPWWISENMMANLIAPGMVTAMLFGIVFLVSGLFVESWEALAFGELAGIVASVVVFHFVWRRLGAWSKRVPAAPEVVRPAMTESMQPPRVAPVKKAA